jgi:hypothetical protein
MDSVGIYTGIMKNILQKHEGNRRKQISTSIEPYGKFIF